MHTYLTINGCWNSETRWWNLKLRQMRVLVIELYFLVGNLGDHVLSLSIMIHYVAVCLYVFHTMFTNVTLASDFICMLLLVFPFKHLLLCIYYITFTCVYYLCIYYITLPVCYISLCIYRFIYWKSVTSDHLVLMLLVLQCTDYK